MDGINQSPSNDQLLTATDLYVSRPSARGSPCLLHPSTIPKISNSLHYSQQQSINHQSSLHHLKRATDRQCQSNRPLPAASSFRTHNTPSLNFHSTASPRTEPHSQQCVDRSPSTTSDATTRLPAACSPASGADQSSRRLGHWRKTSGSCRSIVRRMRRRGW